MVRRIGIALVVFAMVAAFSFASGEKEAGAADGGRTYTLKLGMVVSESDPMFAGSEQFKEAVEERTNGEVQIEIYPSSQLGDTQDLQEAARVGANVGVITDAARLAEMVPELGIMGAPYVVEDYEQAKALVSSEWWRGLENELATQHQLRVLSFNWYQGERHLLTNVPVQTPADLNGIQMRTPGATVWQETIRAMGATPVAMAWAEVYPAIQQGVIDAAEAQMPAIWGASLYEVVDYITKTGHFQLNTPLVVSEEWFQRLPDEYQEIFLEEAFEAGDFASQQTIARSGELESQMAEQGVEVVEIDKTPFIETTQAVYEQVEGYAALKSRVDEIVGR